MIVFEQMAARGVGEGPKLTLWTDRDLDCKVEFPVDPRTPVYALKQLLADETESDPDEFGIRTPCGRVLFDGDVIPEGLLELEVCDPQECSESASNRSGVCFAEGPCMSPIAKTLHRQSPTSSTTTNDWQSDLRDSPRDSV